MKMATEVRTLAELELLALEMASRGCVSRTLAEWPILARAFRAMGWNPPLTIGVAEMRRLSRAAVAELTAAKVTA
jgi:hypothetical protein